MRWIVGCLVVFLGFATPAFAQGKAKGHDKQKHRSESTTRDAVKKVTDETIDAVVDELVGEDAREPATGAMPPGLSKKGKLPPGLEKKGKIPEGWSHGEKTGWEKDTRTEKKESFIKRMVRGIFRRGSNSPADDGAADTQ